MSEKPKREPVSSVPPPTRCPACGGTEFERGMLTTTGYQKTNKRENLALFPKVNGIGAFRCISCNRLEFYVDPTAMRLQQKQISQRVLIALGIYFFFVGIVIFFLMISR